MLWDPTVGPADHSKRKPAPVSCCLAVWRLKDTRISAALQVYVFLACASHAQVLRRAAEDKVENELQHPATSK